MNDKIDGIIAKKKFPPVILIFGEEEFLIEEAHHKLIKSVLTAEGTEFDFEMLDGAETTLERIVDSCVTYPFISEKRVVAVRHFEALSAVNSKKKEIKTSFTRYLESPQTTTILILIAHTDQMAGLTKAMNNPNQLAKSQKIINAAKYPFNLILEKYEWVEFPKIYESEYSTWAKNRLKSQGRDIKPDALELLVANSNQSLRELNSEIEKLLIFIQDKKKVTLEDVTTVSGASRVYNVFELQKAVGRRDISLSLEILQNMLAVDRAEMLIMTIITRYFLTLWKLLDEAPKTTNQYQLAGKVGVNPYFVPEYLESIKRYSPDELDNVFSILAATDETLKSSSTDSLYVLQKMFIKILEKN